jgi:Tfp pilus assembly protein PilZ
MTDEARIPYVHRCVLHRSDGRDEGVICSLGATGAYVTFFPGKGKIPALDERLRLSVLLPGDTTPIDTEAIVEWQNLQDRATVDGLPAGCSLLFTDLTDPDRERIEELMEDYRQSDRPRISPPAPHTGYLRMPYVEPCLLVSQSRTWSGLICNLSVRGAYVTMDPIPPAGQEVRLYFRTPDRRDPLEAHGEIAWVNPESAPRALGLPPGCGVRFLELEDMTRGELELLLLEYESLPRSG